MDKKLTLKWANSLFGFVAVAMIPIPFILFFWGPKIRARSRFARMIEKWKEQQEAAAILKQNSEKLGDTSTVSMGMPDPAHTTTSMNGSLEMGMPVRTEALTEEEGRRNLEITYNLH